MVSSRLQRGKVDMQIYSEPIGVETTVSPFNLPLMAASKAPGEDGCGIGYSMARGLVYSVLMRFPEL